MCKPDTNAGGLGGSQQNSSFLSQPLGTYASRAAYSVSWSRQSLRSWSPGERSPTFEGLRR